MKKLFLHIGPPKTGSTTIQEFLHQNKDNLLNCGYLHPQAGIPKKLLAHHNLAWLITNTKKANPDFGTWKEVHEEIENADVNNVIISAESFGVAKKKHIDILKSELQSYEVKIILYLRRQDLRLESLYTQEVKFGWCSTDILTFFEKKKQILDYYRFLEPWKQTFGLENIIVRPLEKTQISNICYDILNIIGITNYADFREVDNKNIKPGRKALEVLKIANKICQNKPRKQREKFVGKIHKCSQKKYPEEGKYRLLSYSDSSQILDYYKQSNQAVAKEYLGREDGFLFYELLENYENYSFTIEDLSKEELLYLVLALSV